MSLEGTQFESHLNTSYLLVSTSRQMWNIPQVGHDYLLLFQQQSYSPMVYGLDIDSVVKYTPFPIWQI
jgi:hypothetical protein